MAKAKTVSDKSKKSNFIKYILLIITVVVAGTLSVFLGLKLINSKQSELSFVTNKGNIIYTEYKDLGKFRIQIPKDFTLMGSNIIEIKYPDSNRPQSQKKSYIVLY